MQTRLLEGERVRLRPFDENDLDLMVQWNADPEVLQLSEGGPAYPVTREQLVALYFDDETAYWFAVTTLDRELLLGEVGVSNIEAKNRVGQLIISLGRKEYWGRGYGSDALQVMAHYAFTELNLHRLELGVFAFNARAVSAYRRAGFQEEGRRRQAIFRGGDYHDEILMGLLRSEWNAAREERREERTE